MQSDLVLLINLPQVVYFIWSFQTKFLSVTMTMYADGRLEEVNNLYVDSNAAVFVYLTLVMISGLVGNIFSFAYHGFVEKKTVTTFLIAILAVNDLIASVLLINQIINVRYIINFQSLISCKLIRFSNNFVIVNSLVFLNPIGIERYLKVCTQNQRYHMTKGKAAFAIGTLTCYSFVMALRQFWISDIRVTTIHVTDNTTVIGYMCSLIRDGELSKVVRVSFLIDTMSFVLTNIILIVSYSVMARKVRHAYRKVHTQPVLPQGSSNISATITGSNSGCNIATTARSKGQSNSQIEKKLNIMLGTVTVGSVLCYVPYFVAFSLFQPELHPGRYALNPLVQITGRSILLSSSVNPYIFVLFNKRFRTFVTNVLRLRHHNLNIT